MRNIKLSYDENTKTAVFEYELHDVPCKTTSQEPTKEAAAKWFKKIAGRKTAASDAFKDQLSAL